MSTAQVMLEQFKQEAAGTRKALERVPFDKAEWAPHEKSMTLGRLAGHLGSHSVLDTIERMSPRLVVCGHIHGCWGQRSAIGPTLVLNAGPQGQLLDLPE